VLRHVREKAGMRQSAVVKVLTTNATLVSRLEKSDAADPTLAERFLRVLNTALALDVLEYYQREWVNIDPPSFLHPNREHIWQIEATLQLLAGFEASSQNHPLLAPTIASVREDLHAELRYLERTDHVIAWVGDIGVGKTTALAYAARLLTADSKGQPQPVFPVGSGRTTVCETVIKTAPAFGVAVEPHSEDATRALVRDLIAGVAGGRSNVPIEIARVLRNMSGYLLSRAPKGNDFESRDPIAEALANGEDVEILADKVMAAMNLPSRRETSLALSGDVENGMQWLARTIMKINSGRDSRFALPRRITALVQSEGLGGSWDLTIVDTKGVDGITQRSDLDGYLGDPRALVVACTKFPDAPNATVQRILRENEESGSDAISRRRIAMLVLSRNDEPLHVLDQGEPPSSKSEGYAIRRDEIGHALSSAGLPKIPVVFYDAHLDLPNAVWTALHEQIEAMRSVHVDRLGRSVKAVAELIADVDVAKTRGARRDMEEDFDRLADRIRVLPPVRRPAHQNLMDQFNAGHHSSIAASMARRGDWQNFSISHILGVGVRQDANLRTGAHFGGIEHAVTDIDQKYGELADIRAITGGLRDRIAEWRQDFLAQAHSIGSDAFRTVLVAQNDLWTATSSRYGTGAPGYKRDVADMWREFFESSVPDSARRTIEARLADAWMSTVVEPLVAATRAGSLNGAVDATEANSGSP
jgi:transcriptional regulator with XRE-family HTH domain